MERPQKRPSPKKSVLDSGLPTPLPVRSQHPEGRFFWFRPKWHPELSGIILPRASPLSRAWPLWMAGGQVGGNPFQARPFESVFLSFSPRVSFQPFLCSFFSSFFCQHFLCSFFFFPRGFPFQLGFKGAQQGTPPGFLAKADGSFGGLLRLRNESKFSRGPTLPPPHRVTLSLAFL